MAQYDEVGARLSLKDRQKFSRDAERAKDDVEGIGTAAQRASRRAGAMSAAFGSMARGGLSRGLSLVGGAVRGIAIGVGVAGVAVGALVVNTVQSLNRIERIGAQTDAAIRSTGGVANVTRAHIDEMAGSLERLTSVEAEAITEGANLLLTFTNVRNEVGKGNDIFNQATRLGLDMSVALGQDASQSALQLGRALNDPIKGVTALTRSGVSFTQAQRDQIKALQESGDLLGAQKIILGELETQFGGSAEALGNTASGLAAKIGHEFGSISEGIVGGFLPATVPALEWVHGHMVRLADQAPEMGAQVGAAVERITSQTGNLFAAIRDGDTQGVAEVLDNIFGNTGAYVAPIRDLLDRLTDVYDIVQSYGALSAGGRGAIASLFPPEVQPIVRGVLDVISDVVTVVTQGIIPGVEQASSALPAFLSPLGILRGVLGFVANNADLVANALTFVLPIMAALRVATLVLNVAMRANPMGLVITAAILLGAWLIRLYERSETFRNIVDRLWQLLQGAFTSAVDTGRRAIEKLGDKVQAVRDFFSDVGDRARDFMDRLTSFELPSWVTSLGDALGGIGDKIGGLFGGGGDGIGVGTAGSAMPLRPAAGYPAQLAALRGSGLDHTVMSTFRPGARTRSGNLSWHARRRAVDIGGTAGQMLAQNHWIAANYGSITKELILNIPGAINLHNGRPHRYSGAVMGDHRDHNHWALQRGGAFMGGRTYLYGEDGPELGVFPARGHMLPADVTHRVLSATRGGDGVGLSPGTVINVGGVTVVVPDGMDAAAVAALVGDEVAEAVDRAVQRVAAKR